MAVVADVVIGGADAEVVPLPLVHPLLAPGHVVLPRVRPARLLVRPARLPVRLVVVGLDGDVAGMDVVTGVAVADGEVDGEVVVDGVAGMVVAKIISCRPHDIMD